MAFIFLLLLKFSSDVEDALYCFNPPNDESKGEYSHKLWIANKETQCQDPNDRFC